MAANRENGGLVDGKVEVTGRHSLVLSYEEPKPCVVTAFMHLAHRSRLAFVRLDAPPLVSRRAMGPVACWVASTSGAWRIAVGLPGLDRGSARCVWNVSRRRSP